LDIDSDDANSAKAALKEIIMGMNVNLTPQLEAVVQQKISSGLYASATEVVREAHSEGVTEVRRVTRRPLAA
jgi:hypothetical protein